MLSSPDEVTLCFLCNSFVFLRDLLLFTSLLRLLAFLLFRKDFGPDFFAELLTAFFSCFSFDQLPLDPGLFSFQLLLAPLLVLFKFHIEVQFVVLLRQLYDKVGLLCFDVLSLCFFHDFANLGLFVASGLLESVLQVQSFALNRLFESLPGELLSLADFVAPFLTTQFYLGAEMLGFLLSFLLFGLEL